MRWTTTLLRGTIAQFDRIALAIALIIAFAIAYFTHAYVYRTFTDAAAIAALRTTVAAEDIDHDRFVRVRDMLHARATLPPYDPATLHDAFRTAPPPPPAVTTIRPKR